MPYEWRETTGSPVADGRTIGYAVRLGDGRVLVFGGRDTAGGNALLASAELFAPAGETYTATGSMAAQHGNAHSQIFLLGSGAVLIAGGFRPGGDSDDSTAAELYDPSLGTWSATGSLGTRRTVGTDIVQMPSGTLLSDGRVLISGGSNNAQDPLDTAELYNPGTGLWAATGSMPVRRRAHLSVRLADGRVLVFGGYTSGSGFDVDLYTPGTGTWAARADGPSDEWRSAEFPGGSGLSPYNRPMLLDDGRVLVAAGLTAFDGVTYTYTPSSDTWTALPAFAPLQLYATHAAWGATGRLSDGRIAYLVAQFDPARLFVFDPTSDTWSEDSSLLAGWQGQTPLVVLANGDLLSPGRDSVNGALSLLGSPELPRREPLFGRRRSS